MGEKKEKEAQKKPANTQDEREFEEIMKIAERVMREDRDLLRKLAKS